MSIYEGTTGIQSLDLLGRKVSMEKGKALAALLTAMKNTISAAQSAELAPYARKLDEEIARIQAVLAHVARYAAADVDRFLSDATVFMEQVSYVVIGWQWLKMAVMAEAKLKSGDLGTTPKAFFEGKLHTMKFYFRYELPHAEACAKTMMDGEYLTNLKTFERLD